MTTDHKPLIAQLRGEVVLYVTVPKLRESAADALEALQAENKSLQDALVYVAQVGHDTPQHMCPPGVTLYDGDGVKVKSPDGRVAFAGRYPQWEVAYEASKKEPT